MPSKTPAPDSPLPINCVNLSLMPLAKDKKLNTSSDNTTLGADGRRKEQIPGVPKTGKKRRLKKKIKSAKPNSSAGAEFASSNSPAKVKSLIPPETQAKRRTSLVSQSRSSKVHKRKRNWEQGKVTLSYFDPRGKKFSLESLRALLRDVFKSDSATTNTVFKVNFLDKAKNLSVVFVSGLRDSDLVTSINENETFVKLEPSSESKFPFVNATFSNAIRLELTSSKDSMIPPMNVLLKDRLWKRKKKQATNQEKPQLVIQDLFLTEKEMRDNQYPIHSSIDNSESNKLLEGWKETTELEHAGSQTFAIDCEFCDAASGRVLTRISIVNFDSEVVYDTYVQPAEKILNYKTRYSGITEEILKDVTTTFEDVQEKFISLVSSLDVLIGHSLNHDLRVLKIRHPRLIDSALVYKPHKGYPYTPGLKSLSDKFLRRKIQMGESDGSGHSSVEDLKACLDLIKFKLNKRPLFGHDGEVSIFSEGIRPKANCKGRIIDTKVSLYNTITKGSKNVSVLSAKDDEDAVKKFLFQSFEYFFNLLWLNDLRDVSEAASVATEPANGSEESPANSRERILQQTNVRLEKIYQSLPRGSILIVCSDGGNKAEISRLHRIRREFQNQIGAGVDLKDVEGEVWDTAKKAMLHDAVLEACKALALITVKE